MLPAIKSHWYPAKPALSNGRYLRISGQWRHCSGGVSRSTGMNSAEILSEWPITTRCGHWTFRRLDGSFSRRAVIHARKTKGQYSASEDSGVQRPPGPLCVAYRADVRHIRLNDCFPAPLRSDPTRCGHFTFRRLDGSFSRRAVIRARETKGQWSAIAVIRTRPLIFSNGSLRECPRTGAVNQKRTIQWAMPNHWRRGGITSVFFMFEKESIQGAILLQSGGNQINK